MKGRHHVAGALECVGALTPVDDVLLVQRLQSLEKLDQVHPQHPAIPHHGGGERVTVGTNNGVPSVENDGLDDPMQPPDLSISGRYVLRHY
jgi:hypothetical protein